MITLKALRPSARVVLALIAMGTAGAASAQQGGQAREPIAWTTNWFYQDARRNFLEAAELMPEEHYGFKPVPDVRSFGEIVGHIANWQFTNCSAAKGEKNPNATDFEKAEGKADLLSGIKAAYVYCDEVFKSLDLDRLSAAGGGPPVMFRAMSALAHPYLHYGNLITYLRLKGIVPPSTARRGGE